ANSTIEIKDDAQLTVKEGTTLLIRSGSDITIKGSGRIEIEAGGYLCLENGVNIDLQDELSVINLRPGYISGVNTNVISDPTNCLANPSTASFSGNGQINSGFNTDVYVQNVTFSSDRYYACRHISIGESVTAQQPQGPVTIPNGVEVIIDAYGNVLLDEGFELEEGGILEIK
ncbi:MAG: hypothetical protein PVF73_00600, partial [Bacteroidales bacterium]